jgi:hypothetical protein
MRVESREYSKTILKLVTALVFALILLSMARLSYASSPSPTSPELGPDLPPVGASHFDLYLAQRGGIQSLPLSFAELQKDLQQSAREPDRLQSALLIPFGRSLQKPLALLPSPLAFPRVILSLGTELRNTSTALNEKSVLPLHNRFFVGFHEPKEQLEVISWNEPAARFEFQIVRDYSPGKKPKVFYASRSLCMSCHTGGGPIFPIAPWAEMNADISVAALIKKARLLQKDSTNFYQGVQIQDTQDESNNFPRSRKGMAQMFENTVLRAENLLQSQKYWKTYCGQDSSPSRCRESLVYAAALIEVVGIDRERILDAAQGTLPATFSYDEYSSRRVLLEPRSPIFELSEKMNLRVPFSLDGAEEHIEKIFKLLSPSRGQKSIDVVEEKFLTMKLAKEEDPQHPRPETTITSHRGLVGSALHNVGSALFEEQKFAFRNHYALDPSVKERVVFDLLLKNGEARVVAAQFPETNEALFEERSLELIRVGKILHTRVSDDLSLVPGLKTVQMEFLYQSNRYPSVTAYRATLDRGGKNGAETLECLSVDGTRIFCRDLALAKLLAGLDAIQPELYQDSVLNDRLITDPLLGRTPVDLAPLYQAAAKPELMEHATLKELIPKITHPRLKLTLESCGRCHFGEDSVAPTLLLGETEFELFESVRRNSALMLEKVSEEEMPPRKSAEKARLSEHPDIRSRLKSFFGELQAPLEQVAESP